MFLHVSVYSLTGSHAPSAGRFPGTKFFVRDPGPKLQSRRSRLKQEIKRKQVKSACARIFIRVFRAFDLSYAVAEKLSCERHWILVWGNLSHTCHFVCANIISFGHLHFSWSSCSCTNANIILELEKNTINAEKQIYLSLPILHSKSIWCARIQLCHVSPCFRFFLRARDVVVVFYKPLIWGWLYVQYLVVTLNANNRSKYSSPT